jgi:hypothetical protein
VEKLTQHHEEKQFMQRAVIALVVLVLLVAAVSIVPTKLDVRAQQATEAAAAPVVATVSSSHQMAMGPVTETWTSIHIAQQDFQRGFMFWISTQNSMWVLIQPNPNERKGEWRAYTDTFANGEPESDPALDPTLPALYQPRRGFGKLWRDPQTGLREALGYGTTPEFELTTPMSYLSGAGVGRYLIFTLGEQVIALHETTAGQPGGTWEMVGQLEAGPNVIRATPGFGAVAEPTGAATP